MYTFGMKTRIEGDTLIKSIALDPSSESKDFPQTYFKFPVSAAKDLTDRADPFVYALIFPMMQRGGTFVFNGEVSRSVIDNITMFARVWSLWCPGKYKEVTISAREVADDYRPENNRMVAAFSGGLDSSYTVYKYAKRLEPRMRATLDTAVMMWGTDIPLTEREQFEAAFVNAKKMTDDLGIELIPVETNCRAVHDNGIWEDCFGTFVAATLCFFGKTHFYGAAAGADSVNEFPMIWGINPITDRYLSSDTFQFIVDGFERTRTEKAAFIKDWKAGIEHLRVCWRHADKSKNCGVCEKCVRTKLNFKVVGIENLPSMPTPLTVKELKKENLIQAPLNISYFKDSYNYALKHRTLSADWLKLLDSQIKEWEKLFTPDGKRRHHSLWWHIKRGKF